MSKYTTRVLYRKKTKQQISDSVKRPEITPISKKKLNKEIRKRGGIPRQEVEEYTRHKQ